jgi:hypothetical protein
MKMEIKKLTPDAYRLHDFLKEHAIGKNNAIKANDLCLKLGLTSTRELRKLRAEVNSGISELNKKILTSNNGYFVAGATTPEEAYKQYKDSAWRKIKMGVSMIQEGQRLLKMIGEDTQTRLDITGGLKDIEIYVNEAAKDVKRAANEIKGVGSILTELDSLLADPLVQEAMKLYGAKPEDDELDEDEEIEYTDEDAKADDADNINDEIKLGLRDKDGNFNE